MGFPAPSEVPQRRLPWAVSAAGAPGNRSTEFQRPRAAGSWVRGAAASLGVKTRENDGKMG